MEVRCQFLFVAQNLDLPLLSFSPHCSSEDYKKHFLRRDLQAYSVHPLLVYPTHYTGDADWMSDTETSTIWDDDSRKTGWSGSQKTLKDVREARGTSGHSFRSVSRDEL